MKYEGNYLNGKRNGIGKEFYESGIKLFKGEYLAGKKWNGKGFNLRGSKVYEILNGGGCIENYNKNGRLIFEGNYLNGEKNGKGIEYNNGLKVFEGEYYKGKKWNGIGYDPQENEVYRITNGKGLIKEYNDNGALEFEGEFFNWEKNGKAKEYLYKSMKYVDNIFLYSFIIYEFKGEYFCGKKTVNLKYLEIII